LFISLATQSGNFWIHPCMSLWKFVNYKPEGTNSF